VVNPANSDIRMEVSEFFEVEGPKVVLECAGADGALQLAIDVARPGGRIGVIGLNNHPIATSIWNMVVKSLNVYGVIEIDLPGGMEIIRQKRVDCREFLSEIIPLERAPEAFERLLEPIDEVKIVIEHG
jgi:threonine dehydrogenase-like Zn-dependent dehydrogenase